MFLGREAVVVEAIKEKVSDVWIDARCDCFFISPSNEENARVVSDDNDLRTFLFNLIQIERKEEKKGQTSRR